MINDTYECVFYSENLEKYSQVPIHFLPRVGDVIQNSGAIERVKLVEYGFNLGVYNIYTEHLGHTSEHEDIIKELLAQKSE